MKILNKKLNGFTLIEIMVVIGIIGILSAVLFANFSEARMQARDKARMTTLKEMQLAIEFYKAQNGSYPVAGCGAVGDAFSGPGPRVGLLTSCPLYIEGLVPDFISVLPNDPVFEQEAGRGYYYASNETSYKLMSLDSVEVLTVSLGDEFARCPSATGACSGGIPTNTYAVYSSGAEAW